MQNPVILAFLPPYSNINAHWCLEKPTPGSDFKGASPGSESDNNGPQGLVKKHVPPPGIDSPKALCLS